MKVYSNQETIDKFFDELKTNGISQIYNADSVNWSGQTKENSFYTEVLSKEIAQIMNQFDDESIKITRETSYKTETHAEICFNINESNRLEEIFAKRIFGLKFSEIGTIIDYQIPIRNTAEDKGFKAVDLLSYDGSKNTLYLTEIKYLGNKADTLLKTLLECYTYYKIIDLEKLAMDFTNKKDVNVVPTVMLVSSDENECLAYKEYEEMEIEERPMLKALSLLMGIKFVTLDLPEIFY